MDYKVVDHHIKEVYKGNAKNLSNSTILGAIQDDEFVLYIKLEYNPSTDSQEFKIQFKRQGGELAIYQEFVDYKHTTLSELESTLVNVFLYQRFKAKKS